MSAKHAIVPRGFTAADADSCNLEKCERVTARQARALRQAGLIVQLGESGRIWQRTEICLARASEETGNGRVSLEVPRSIKELLTAEMGGMPSWAVEEAYG